MYKVKRKCKIEDCELKTCLFIKKNNVEAKNFENMLQAVILIIGVLFKHFITFEPKYQRRLEW